MSYILLRNGLANRLRTIAGYIYVSLKTGREFIFHWDIKNIDCNGNFNDIFNPIDGIKIIDCARDSNINYYLVGQNTIANILEKEEIKANVKDVENEVYRLFIPKEHVAREIDSFPLIAAAIHVRRTDHVELAKSKSKYIENEQFIKFIENHAQVFLATDDYETQQFFMKFENIIIRRPILPNNNFRQTSLEDAVIDVFIAARSEHFMGTEYSSYSQLIRIFQRLRLYL